MLPFAHLGIGRQLVSLCARQVPLAAVLWGTMLPDLIDKPLYYIPSLLTGRHGAELSWICGTRSIGHSVLFFAFLLGMALRKKPSSHTWLGLALGAATHLLLDNFAEPFSALTPYSSRIALLYPVYGLQFPLALHRSVSEHLSMHLSPFELGSEALGAGLLARMWWRVQRKKSP